jgi:glycosyltransferase involved in cell wall biosynthesis
MLYGKPLYGSLFPILLLFLRMFRFKTITTVQSIVSPSFVNNDFFERYGENSSLVELKKIAFKLVTLLMFSLSDKVVVHSNVSKETLVQEYGIAPKKIATIYHGVAKMSSISKWEAEKKLNLYKRRVILQFGFIHAKKGVEYVINAMPRVLQDCPDAFLIVAGGSYSTLADEYEKYAMKLKLMVKDLKLESCVSFTEGFVDDELVSYYFGLADVVVLPYLEHFGSSGVLSQVISSGKPVVVSNVNPFGEMIIHNVNGLVVPPADSEELAKSIIRVLSDKKFGTELSMNLKRYREELGWEKMAMKYLKEYSLEVNEK